ncbi:WxL domain-containing protein [Candidatus Enterococcus ferrettii]|nr:WxL domain-containing protein [Enterococcus sp. 665A]
MLASICVSILLIGNFGVSLGYAEIQSISKTTGYLELVENTNPIEPKDPDNPTNPLYPSSEFEEDHIVTGNIGPLSLDVAPGTFDFGQQEMYQTAHMYQGVGAENSDQYIQVTDNRDAHVVGWVVSVRQISYLTSENNVLEGSLIHIPTGEARNTLNHDTTKIDPTLTGKAVEIGLEEEKIFYPNSPVAGKGTSILKWRSNDVALTIPAKQAKQGNYKNTILWTLTADAVY